MYTFNEYTGTNMQSSESSLSVIIQRITIVTNNTIIGIMQLTRHMFE